MFPYNICENKWLSDSRRKAKKHYNTYQPVYLVLAGIIATSIVALAIITSISSFL